MQRRLTTATFTLLAGLLMNMALPVPQCRAAYPAEDRLHVLFIGPAHSYDGQAAADCTLLESLTDVRFSVLPVPHDSGDHIADIDGHFGKDPRWTAIRKAAILERLQQKHDAVMLAGLRTGLETQGGECPPALAFRRVSPFGDAAGSADRLLAETGWRLDSAAKPFTALVCYNDLLASHAVMRLQELGVSVPEDISVAGFDGVNHAWYDGPKLTTCALPLEDIGAEAARMVYWRIEHPDAPRRKLSLETELVEGESVGWGEPEARG